jgi:hypothetical protein
MIARNDFATSPFNILNRYFGHHTHGICNPILRVIIS